VQKDCFGIKNFKLRRWKKHEDFMAEEIETEKFSLSRDVGEWIIALTLSYS
jgi:hypothetical protein